MRLPRRITDEKLWGALVGREVGRDGYIEDQSRARVLREQSQDIAGRLAGQGIELRDTSRALVFIGACSGLIDKKAISYRNSNLLPEVQSRNVHTVMRELQCFMDHQDARKMRMLTVSAGWVPLIHYKREHQALLRRISKYFRRRVVIEAGIEPIFYNVENTIKRGDDGQIYLNLHSHILIRAGRYLGREKWAAFLEDARGWFPKGYVHDSPLKKAAEVVKYVFKPSEFEKLEGWELALLAVQCHRQKFFHPVGRFKLWRRKLKEEGLRVKRVPKGDQWEWRSVPKAKRDIPEKGAPPPPAGRVIAITAPSPRLSTRMEPILVVEGYAGDLDALAHQNGIEGVLDRARRLWHRAAAQPRVSIEDTTTTTVLNDHHPPPRSTRAREGGPPCHAN